MISDSFHHLKNTLLIELYFTMSFVEAEYMGIQV